MDRPLYIQIMDAYETGALTGPQSIESLGSYLGVAGGQRLGKPLFVLGFEKRYCPDGGALYHPPRRTRGRKYLWPERHILTRRILDRGESPNVALKTIEAFGTEMVREALDEADKRQSGDPIYALTMAKSHEVNALKVKNAEEVITVAELAEILRESPNMPKEALLNRARGLVKAATRKGNWDEFRKSTTSQGAV